MENETRFSLNAAIESWRSELAAQPNLASDDRQELETHLLDAIAGFQQRGLNDEESFWLARKRVGQPQQLGEEFVKANPAAVWRERIFWLALGIICWQLTLMLVNVAKITLNYLTPGLHIFYHKIGFWPADVAILIAGIILARGWFVQSMRPAWFLKNRFRLVLSAMVLIVFMAAMQIGIIRQIDLNRGYDSVVGWGLGIWFHHFLHLTLSCLKFSVVPLVFLILFFPTQNHRTPNHA
jgi:hypothetical protein